MKKILFVSGLILILAVVTVSAIIIFKPTGKIDDLGIDLQGTWLVYRYADTNIDDELMVFEEDKVKDYRGNDETPFSTSSYALEGSNLKFTDVGKEYTIRIISDNNIILIEPDTRELKLVRVADSGKEIKPVTPSDLVGSYDVVMMAGEKRQNETMNFSQLDLTDYRNGEKYLSSKYEMNGAHLLFAVDISKEFLTYKCDSRLILVDRQDRYVWELMLK